MRADPRDSGGYSIDVSAIPVAARGDHPAGYRARVVVRRMPATQVVLRDEFPTSGPPFDQPGAALAAALARGQRFVRSQFQGRVAGACEGEGEGQSCDLLP
jgi:hypothetical protein